jgi:hypothetical protein
MRLCCNVAGYWKSVALSLQLTNDQKAALKMSWARVKANKVALTEQHSALSERLQLRQLRQQQVQLEFEMQAAQLHGLQLPYGVRQLRRVKESALQQQQQQERQSQQEVPQHAAVAHQLQQTVSVGMQQPSRAELLQQGMPLPEVLAEQQQQQVVYIPVLSSFQQQAADAGLVQLQPGGVLQQQASPQLVQQLSEPLSRAGDGSFACSTNSVGAGCGVPLQQQQQLAPSNAISAASPTAVVNVPVSPAAAAAMPGSPCLPAGSCNAAGAAAAVSPEVSGDLTDMAETSRSSFGSAMSNPVGMLLPVSMHIPFLSAPCNAFTAVASLPSMPSNCPNSWWAACAVYEHMLVSLWVCSEVIYLHALD